MKLELFCTTNSDNLKDGHPTNSQLGFGGKVANLLGRPHMTVELTQADGSLAQKESVKSALLTAMVNEKTYIGFTMTPEGSKEGSYPVCYFTLQHTSFTYPGYDHDRLNSPSTTINKVKVTNLTLCEKNIGSTGIQKNQEEIKALVNDPNMYRNYNSHEDQAGTLAKQFLTLAGEIKSATSSATDDSDNSPTPLK